MLVATLSVSWYFNLHHTKFQAPPAQSLGVFTGVVVIVSVGSLVVTIQAKVRFIFPPSFRLLLITKTHRSSSEAACRSPALLFPHTPHFDHSPSSFFQALCVLGYCVAPLDIAALIACFVRKLWIRAPIALLAWAWCCWGEPVSLLFGNAHSTYIIFMQRLLIFLMEQKSSSNAYY